MAARSKSRKRALDLLFEADQRSLDPLRVLEERAADEASPAVNEYARALVEGVAAHRSRIDEVLTTYSQGWPLARMPAVDRQVLRIGVWELLWNDEVPDGVAISEAVELATALSTDESPGFVNGLLSRISELKPGLIA